MSDEHFTVDGMLIEAWTSQKSFRRKDGQGTTRHAGYEVSQRKRKRVEQVFR
jgi:hypothetical protein